MPWLRILIATIGFGGALLFGSAFVASYTHPTSQMVRPGLIRIPETQGER